MLNGELLLQRSPTKNGIIKLFERWACWELAILSAFYKAVLKNT
jgi:hypothetical protein